MNTKRILLMAFILLIGSACGYIPADPRAGDEPAARDRSVGLNAVYFGQDGQMHAGQGCQRGFSPDNIHIQLEGISPDVSANRYTVEDAAAGGVWANPCDPRSTWQLSVIPGAPGTADLYFKPLRSTAEGAQYTITVEYSDGSQVMIVVDSETP